MRRRCPILQAGSESRARAAIDWLNETRCLEPEDAADVEAIVVGLSAELQDYIDSYERQLQRGAPFVSHALGFSLTHAIAEDEGLIEGLAEVLDRFKAGCPPPLVFEVAMGGGSAFLTLPDSEFTFKVNDEGDVVKKQDNLDFSDYGGGVSASLEVPLVRHWSLGADGYFSSVSNDKTTRCEQQPGVLRRDRYRRRARNPHDPNNRRPQDPSEQGRQPLGSRRQDQPHLAIALK